MTQLSDRQTLVSNVREAIGCGARQDRACAEAGISARTFRRRTQSGSVSADRRPLVRRPAPRNKLSDEERTEIISLCNSEEFASLPPSQIVPILADQGRYVASEASFYRVLRDHDQLRHRGRAKPPQRRKPPTSHCAAAPRQVWSWDVTWLPGPVMGSFFYLYVIIDIYSRKIVGWEVYAQENAENSAEMIRRAVIAENCLTRPLVLHADNGSPMKGATLKTTLEKLGVIASYSRPRVSNDNPFSEALFRTCKYRPEYPRRGFANIDAARDWVSGFMSWYNGKHLHSAIRFVTPSMRHAGLDGEALEKRALLYEKSRAARPERWSGRVRNWTPVGAVWLNPERTETGSKITEAA